MTRKDFKLIAEVLAYRRMAVHMFAKDTVAGRLAERTALAELNLTTFGLADALATTNSRFDRDRFITAARGEM